MTFNVGDKVKYRNMRDAAFVLSGPHPSPGNDRYLIEKPDGNVSLVKITELTPFDERRARMRDAVHRAIWNRGFSSASELSRGRTDRVVDAVLEVLELGAPLKAGDRIRVLKDRACHAAVSAGDILTVVDPDVHGDGITFTTNVPDGFRDVWYFRHSGHGVDWERI